MLGGPITKPDPEFGFLIGKAEFAQIGTFFLEQISLPEKFC